MAPGIAGIGFIPGQRELLLLLANVGTLVSLVTKLVKLFVAGFRAINGSLLLITN